MATHDSSDVLAFADETIVMREGKLIQKNKTSEVYRGLTDKYTASLFDEVNEIPAALLDKNKQELILLYPHQIKVVEHSNFKVKIKNSYCEGGFYLIQAIHEDRTVYFENKLALEVGAFFFLARNE